MFERLFNLLLLNKLTRLFKKMSRGFLFVPALLAIWGAIAAGIIVLIDRNPMVISFLEQLSIFQISVEGARAVLSTIAGAMMTVISLVYSLTLVVFTLAAGNLGPRLLENFSNNRINQITIGLLSATFLYSLIVLYITGEDEIPRLSVSVSILFAACSLFWLIYFVHNVAGRVMIDNEIGRTRRTLRRAIDRVLADDLVDGYKDKSAIPQGQAKILNASKTGYITEIDGTSLVEIAAKNNAFIKMLVTPGEFIIEGMPIAELYGSFDDELETQVWFSISTDDARAPAGDVQFSVHLMVEIALRALSPGINDSYTAISAIDHLSAGLSRILRRGAPASMKCDTEDIPRLWLKLIEVDNIIGAALHPLRQAVQGDTLMTIKLLWALQRLANLSLPEYYPIIWLHLKAISEDANRMVSASIDRSEIAENIGAVGSVLRRNVRA